MDEDGFRRLMKEQRDRAKADARAKKTGHADLSAYREVADSSGCHRVHRLHLAPRASRPSSACSSTACSSPAATEGDEVEVVLDRTPFYAEGGGQLADTGRIRLDSGAVIEVRDVQQPVPGVSVHKGVVQVGEVTVGAAALRRRSTCAAAAAIARAHSATHLTHQALRDALGPTAAQAGSENSPGRFRFDFGSPGRRPRHGPHRRRAEDQRGARPRTRRHRRGHDASTRPRSRAPSPSSARSTASGSASSPSATSPRSCAAAPTSTTPPSSAWSSCSASRRSAPACAASRPWSASTPTTSWPASTRSSPSSPELVKGRPEELPEKISGMLAKLKDAEKEIEKFRAEKVLQAAAGLAEAAKDVTRRRPGHRPGAGRHRRRRPAQAGPRRPAAASRAAAPAVVALFTVASGRPLTVIATNEAARERGLKAGDLVRTAAKTLGGGGGGKHDVAQGGGQNPAAVGEAVDAVERLVAETA